MSKGEEEGWRDELDSSFGFKKKRRRGNCLKFKVKISQQNPMYRISTVFEEKKRCQKVVKKKIKENKHTILSNAKTSSPTDRSLKR